MTKKDNIPFHFCFYSTPSISDPLRDIADNNPAIGKYTFRYEAFFFGGEDLRIYPVGATPDTLGGQVEIILYPGSKKPLTHQRDMALADIPNFMNGISEPWELFFRFCSFSEVINAMSHESSFSDWTVQDTEIASVNDKMMLTMIKNDPHVLHDEMTRITFIDMLVRAIHSADKNKRELARYLIDKYLFQRFGDKKPAVTDKRQGKLALAILQSLANHLCHEVLNFCDMSQRDCKKSKKLNELISHIRKPDVQQDLDWRLAIIPDEYIKLLVLSPKTKFISRLIKDNLDGSPEDILK
jgi:hypothetical protein